MVIVLLMFIFLFIYIYIFTMDELSVGVWLERPYVRLGLMIAVMLVLIFLAGKAGFGLWIVSTLNLNREHLEGPPGSAAQALSAYDMIRVSPDLYR
jgi:hypothetical protein